MAEILMGALIMLIGIIVGAAISSIKEKKGVDDD